MRTATLLATQSQHLVSSIRHIVESGRLVCLKEEFSDLTDTISASEKHARKSHSHFAGELSSALSELRKSYNELLADSSDRFFIQDAAEETLTTVTTEGSTEVPSSSVSSTHTTYNPYDENDFETILDQQMNMSDISCTLDEFESYLEDIVLH